MPAVRRAGSGGQVAALSRRVALRVEAASARSIRSEGVVVR